MKCNSGEVSVNAPDGEYIEEISGEEITVSGGKVKCSGKPIIFEVN
ncbi:MAG: hypothetical protein ACI4IJ_04515 [Acutalibacteraceae bacterium]